MATKRANVNDRLNVNVNQGKRPLNINMKRNTFTENKLDDDKVDIDDIHELINDEEDVIETTTTSSTSNTSNSISFKSYINNAYKLNSDNIKYEIDVIVLNAVNSIQCKYARDDNGKTIRVNFFDSKTNSTLLKDVSEQVIQLVQSINITIDEKNDYFSRIIDDFLRQRLKYIIQVGLDEMFTPKEIELAMTEFMSSGKDFFDNYDELLDEYLNHYKNLAFYLVEARVDRSTFYVSEIIMEAIKLIKKDTNIDISAYINELLLNNIDVNYIEQARKNMYDRKPFNNMLTKTHKKLMRQYDLI